MSFVRKSLRVLTETGMAATLLVSAPLWAADKVVSHVRPHVVIILADDLGYSDIGCFGSEIATPNLDRMANQGLRLTQFYTTPRCCPTRAAVLTGLHPHQAGIGHMMEDRGIPGYLGELSPKIPTIAEELSEAGYHTAMSGKWHVSRIHFNGKKQLNYESDEPFWENKLGWPMQRGFQEFYGTIHGVNSFFDPFSLVEGNDPIRPDRTNFYYTDAITEKAVAAIERTRSEKPLFLYVAYTAPHWPLHAPEELIAKYRDHYLVGWDVIRNNRRRKQVELGLLSPDWALTRRDPRVPPWEAVRDKEWEANRMATHAAMIECMDSGIGRILGALRNRGMEKNTLVMFFSDNGACAEVLDPGWYDIPSKTRDGRTIKVGNGDHSVFAGPEDVWQSYGVPWANVSSTPFVLYKHYTHEGGIATPFIAQWPAVITNVGGISPSVGHVVDIMATAVDVSGAKHPDSFKGNPVPPLEGRSLVPVFQGQPLDRQSALCWEHEGNRAVRHGKWKLVARHGALWELYDMEADRTELNNLASANPQMVEKLSKLYHEWAERCQVVPFDKLPPIRATAPAKKTK